MKGNLGLFHQRKQKNPQTHQTELLLAVGGAAVSHRRQSGVHEEAPMTADELYQAAAGRHSGESEAWTSLMWWR